MPHDPRDPFDLDEIFGVSDINDEDHEDFGLDEQGLSGGLTPASDLFSAGASSAAEAKFLSDMPESDRVHLQQSQKPCVEELLRRYGARERTPMQVVYLSDETRWLNGCRAALRRLWERSQDELRARGEDPLPESFRPRIHYKNSDSSGLGYRKIEMWLSTDPHGSDGESFANYFIEGKD